jgi:hypothetical protein
LVKDYIICYQGSSPILLFQTIVILAKSIECLAHELTLINTKLYIFQVANKVFSKYRKTKKNRIYQGDIFIIEEAYDIITQDEVNKQIRYDKYSRGVNREEGNSIMRYYNTCGKTGYNTRICQEVVDISSLSDSKK